MNTMSYKGFIGSVGYDDTDAIFCGKIEGINSLINFEGESVQELRDAFCEAVDAYVAYCEAEGIEARKSYSGTLNVRISPDTHNKIAVLAKRSGISINAFIKDALDRAVMAML